MANLPRITADRLYAISLRPQELALYGNAVAVELRRSVMTDDPAAITATHAVIVVLTLHAPLPAELVSAEQADAPAQQLELLKIGWELDLQVDPPCAAADLLESPVEMRLALDRCAETANDLARRAGVDPPFNPELLDQIILDYRRDLG